MPESPPLDDAPLRAWRFAGRLRRYQADVLDRVDVDAERPLHIVAPPGSGKTLLGLLLAIRRGRRTLVLAPTTTIRRTNAYIPSMLRSITALSPRGRAILWWPIRLESPAARTTPSILLIVRSFWMPERFGRIADICSGALHWVDERDPCLLGHPDPVNARMG